MSMDSEFLDVSEDVSNPWLKKVLAMEKLGQGESKAQISCRDIKGLKLKLFFLYLNMFSTSNGYSF